MSAIPKKHCTHHTLDSLPYLAASFDADERIARGEKQTQCPVCKRWLWAHEVGHV